MVLSHPKLECWQTWSCAGTPAALSFRHTQKALLSSGSRWPLTVKLFLPASSVMVCGPWGEGICGFVSEPLLTWTSSAACLLTPGDLLLWTPKSSPAHTALPGIHLRAPLRSLALLPDWAPTLPGGAHPRDRNWSQVYFLFGAGDERQAWGF